MNLSKTLGSKVKISILYHLWKVKSEGEQSLFEKELAERTGFSQAGISKVSKDLENGGFIKVASRGKMKFYELSENNLTKKLIELFREWNK